MGRFEGLKDAMGHTDDREAGEEVGTTEVAPAPDYGPEISMTIKTPKALRDYWTGKARMEGVTLKDFVHQALTERFGTPDTQ